MQSPAEILERRERRGAIRHGSWLDVTPEVREAGLSGRVLLCSATWLICVYCSAINSERIDPAREKLRLGNLLRAAAMAWREKLRVAGMRRKSCVFSYEPGNEARRPPGNCDQPFSGVRLEITTRGNDDGTWTTTISLAD